MIFGCKTQPICRGCGHRFSGKLRTRRLTIRSVYCSHCFCRGVPGSGFCRNPRISATLRGAHEEWRAYGLGATLLADTPYCLDHMTCHDHSEGTRCFRFVKKHEPEQYHYCDQHSCVSPDCNVQRTAEHPCCGDHRCATAGCLTPRIGREAYCPTHTCEMPRCFGECAGEGPVGGRGRRCEHHRHCSAAGCRRPCHRRDDGEYTTLCGLHYCRFPGCGRQRVHLLDGDAALLGGAAAVDAAERQVGWGGFCAEHVCKAAGCGNMRAAVALRAEWCHLHECAVLACRYARISGSTFCREHVCARRGCVRRAAEGEAEGYCSRHRACQEPGCSRDRHVEGDTVHERCDKHCYVACRWDRCEERPVGESAYCEAHVCGHRACHDGRLPGRASLYCGGHTCAAEGCGELRRHAAQPDGGVAIGGGAGQTAYCSNHCCGNAECGERRVGDHAYCGRHACVIDGCRDQGTVPVPPQAVNGQIIRNNDAKVCEAHYIKGEYRRQGNATIGSPVMGDHAADEMYGPNLLGRLLGIHGEQRARTLPEPGIHIYADSPGPRHDPSQWHWHHW